MSNVNIKRAVENIRTNTTVYTPVVEMIVNGIQAVDETGRKDGKVLARVQRSTQAELDASLPEVIGFDIEDNGIGFTDAHRKSFDTLYSDFKIEEGVVHDIIFPRKGDSDSTSFHDHNLWIVDERLNFTTWVSSDVPLGGKNADRPDLLVYNKRVLFRGDNEASNPITIFEFKKPQRDDFVNPSSHEDPVQQIVCYVNDIRDGKYKTPEGRKMLVAENTPFYGYVVCDLTPKVETWLEREKNFTPMPDRLGWFHWMGNINLYVEVMSWDKVLRDAKMRNQIFFQKLGI
ncbi:hypothetical protein [Chrysiogenes arsenatis]|uniref:hypothetical protein n=1 Tax=Chrysiogenes arsenatis TaxID=309797 RepID=UPI0004275E1B|nr:hypothetical protein [Chrysiogenes arsenatis]